jgi:hypothetical protein
MLLFPIYAGAMLAVTVFYPIRSGHKIDWLFAAGGGFFMAVVNVLVPPTKWRPRLSKFE